MLKGLVGSLGLGSVVAVICLVSSRTFVLRSWGYFSTRGQWVCGLLIASVRPVLGLRVVVLELSLGRWTADDVRVLADPLT